MTAPGPNAGAIGPFSVSIVVGGAALASEIQVCSVETSRRIGKPGSARIVISTGLADSRRAPMFALGAEIAIAAGYGGVETAIDRGLVVAKTLTVDRERALVIIDIASAAILAARPEEPPVLLIELGDSIMSLRLRRDAAGLAGKVEFQGSSIAAPGCRVTLAGLGQDWNGDHLVSGVRHCIAESDWSTVVEFGPAD